ncbi:MAG TPA: hypothetical protein VGM75_33845 [Pseudonocardiaceae bacterium]|jgi:hypothetical protein
MNLMASCTVDCLLATVAGRTQLAGCRAHGSRVEQESETEQDNEETRACTPC